MSDNSPWVKLQDVCEMYGLTIASARNAIKKDRFPVPTYKAGKFIVIDRCVHESYFNGKREAGLLALRNNKK